MKTKLLILLIGLLFCLAALESALRITGYFYGAAIEKSNQAALANQNAVRILCIGDSITAMGGEHAWPRLLQDMLQEEYQRPFAVINKAGINSNSNDLIRELPKNIANINPQLLCVMMGVNDKNIPTYDQNTTPPPRALWRSLRIAEFARLLLRNVLSDQNIPKNENEEERALLYEATKANYLRLAKETEKLAIPLLVASYPNRSVKPLKSYLAGFSHIEFIDNETSFRELLDFHSYDQLFIDYYREDFGHGTALGNREKALNFVRTVQKSLVPAVQELF